MEEPPSFHWYLKIIQFTCTTKMIPFNWNPKTRRFLPAGRRKLREKFLIKFVEVVLFSFTIFSFFRLLANIGKDRTEFPLFMKVVNISWLIASVVITIVSVQNNILRNDVMEYGNTLMAKLTKNGYIVYCIIIIAIIGTMTH